MRWICAALLFLFAPSAQAHQGLSWVFSASYEEETQAGVEASISSPVIGQGTLVLVCFDSGALRFEVRHPGLEPHFTAVAVFVDQDRFLLTEPPEILTNEGEPNGVSVPLTDVDPLAPMLNALKAGDVIELSHPHVSGTDWSLGVWSLRGSRVAIEAFEAACDVPFL